MCRPSFQVFALESSLHIHQTIPAVFFLLAVFIFSKNQAHKTQKQSSTPLGPGPTLHPPYNCLSMAVEDGRHSPETEGATLGVHAARCLQCAVETLIPQEHTGPRSVEEAAEIPVSQTQGRVVEVISQEKMQEQAIATVKAIPRAMPGPRIQEHINTAVKVSSLQQCIVEETGSVRVPRVQEQIVEVRR